jgi:hypothetical protein
MGTSGPLGEAAPSGDQLEEQNDYGHDDEHVNEAAPDVKGEEPERPQDE